MLTRIAGTLLILAGLLLPSGLRAQGTLELLKRVDIDLGTGSHTIDLTDTKGAFRALRIKAISGRITLRSRALTNWIIGDQRHKVVANIEIEDDGPGVAPELGDSIFYPLVSGRSDGTGLGLPLAQEILSRHGGLIEYRSRPGETVFMLRLPVEPVEAQPHSGGAA